MRPFNMDDVELAHRNWMSDPDVAHFTTWHPHTDVEHTRSIIASWVAEYPRGSLDWCIVDRASGMPIGSVTAVRDHPGQGWCEMGYCLSQDFWDAGIMTEALRAVVCFIFDMTDYVWIQARHETENEASGRVLEKCCFKPIGIRDMTNPKTGRMTEYRFMRIERRDLGIQD